MKKLRRYLIIIVTLHSITKTYNNKKTMRCIMWKMTEEGKPASSFITQLYYLRMFSADENKSSARLFIVAIHSIYIYFSASYDHRINYTLYATSPYDGRVPRCIELQYIFG